MRKTAAAVAADAAAVPVLVAAKAARASAARAWAGRPWAVRAGAGPRCALRALQAHASAALQWAHALPERVSREAARDGPAAIGKAASGPAAGGKAVTGTDGGGCGRARG